MGSRIDMEGKRCGKLLVIGPAGKYRGCEMQWRCQCECGKETIVRGHYLRSGHTKSCGNCNVYKLEGAHIRCSVASGRSFIFDTSDRELVEGFVWSIDRKGYVSSHDGGKLHRLLMQPSADDVVDHINGNPCDCRRENLRVVKQRHNTYNQGLRVNSTTGYKGVHFDKRRQKYMAHIHPDKHTKFLGYHDTSKEAAKAYNKAASFYFGEFARLNEI